MGETSDIPNQEFITNPDQKREFDAVIRKDPTVKAGTEIMEEQEERADLPEIDRMLDEYSEVLQLLNAETDPVRIAALEGQRDALRARVEDYQAFGPALERENVAAVDRLTTLEKDLGVWIDPATTESGPHIDGLEPYVIPEGTLDVKSEMLLRFNSLRDFWTHERGQYMDAVWKIPADNPKRQEMLDKIKVYYRDSARKQEGLIQPFIGDDRDKKVADYTTEQWADLVSWAEEDFEEMLLLTREAETIVAQPNKEPQPTNQA